jgi:hypothetical protein
VASLLPLDGSVVQRLQRFGTYSHLKQIVLRIITHEITDQDAERKTSLGQLRCARQPPGLTPCSDPADRLCTHTYLLSRPCQLHAVVQSGQCCRA